MFKQCMSRNIIYSLLSVLLTAVVVLPVPSSTHAQTPVRLMVVEERAEYWHEVLSIQGLAYELEVMPRGELPYMLLDRLAAGETFHVVEAPMIAVELLAAEMPDAMVDLTGIQEQLMEAGYEVVEANGRIVGLHMEDGLVLLFCAPEQWNGELVLNFVNELPQPAKPPSKTCINFSLQPLGPIPAGTMLSIDGVDLYLLGGGNIMLDSSSNQVLMVTPASPNNVEITLPNYTSYADMTAMNLGGDPINVAFRRNKTKPGSVGTVAGNPINPDATYKTVSSFAGKAIIHYIIVPDVASELVIKEVCYYAP